MLKVFYMHIVAAAHKELNQLYELRVENQIHMNLCDMNSVGAPKNIYSLRTLLCVRQRHRENENNTTLIGKCGLSAAKTENPEAYETYVPCSYDCNNTTTSLGNFFFAPSPKYTNNTHHESAVEQHKSNFCGVFGAMSLEPSSTRCGSLEREHRCASRMTMLFLLFVVKIVQARAQCRSIVGRIYIVYWLWM